MNLEDHSNDVYTKIVVSLVRNLPDELKTSLAYPCLELGGQIDTSNHEYFKYDTVSLSKVVYDKRMFRPGSVVLTFTLTTKGAAPGRSIQEMSRYVLKKMNFIDLIGVKDNIPADKCTKSDLVYIARNYYIQSHQVQKIGTDEHILTIKCYSFDRKLSLSKYCNVYTGKPIATGIAKEGIDSQLSTIKGYLDNLIPDEKTKINTSSSADNIYFSGDSLSNINLNNLLMLGYHEDYSDGKVYSARRTYDQNNKELKHPYLVQYNESFYDFLSRVLHRCGEFFYFEHGKINIGLPEATRQFIFNVTEDGVPDIPSDRHFSPLCTFSTNVSGESSEEVESGIDSYGSDYINTPSAIDASRKYRDAETTSDEALHVVTEEDNRYHPFGMWILYKALGSLFIADSFLGGIGYAAGYAAWDIVNTTFVLPVFCVDPDYKKHHLDSGENLKDVNDLGENARVDSIGADEIANLCNNYFRDIERWENTSAETLVEVNFESVLRQIYLGDIICLDNLVNSPACVVVSIHGEYSGKEASNTAEVIPITRLSGKKGGLYAVSVPVSSQVEHIKKVSTMEAIVTDTRDPLRLGRVRVRYPWQPEGTEDKSPWLRVKVPFAGGTKERYKDSHNPGFCMTPGEGEHVALDYTGGNIERPFVSGSFYYLSSDGESDHVPPMSSIHDGSSKFFKTDHQYRTIASGKGHALVFEDLDNTDLLSQAIPLAGAITQMCQIPEFNETGKYQANEVFGTIQGGSVTLRDGTGITTISLTPNKREISIDSRLGKVTLNAFTGININAPNGDVVIKGKNVTIQAGNNLSIEAGTNIQDGESARLVSETGAGLLGMLGGIIICEGTACAIGVDFTNVFDLSFLRSVVETALRPVEGTLCLRSKRNVVMTAGRGHVTMTSSMMSQTSTYTGKKDPSGSKMTAFSELPSNKVNDAAVESYEYVAVRNFIAECVKQADEQFNEYRDKLIVLISLLQKVQQWYTGMTRTVKSYWVSNRDYSTCPKIYDKIRDDQRKIEDRTELFQGYSQSDSATKRTLSDAFSTYSELHTQLWDAIDALKTPLTYADFASKCKSDDAVTTKLDGVSDKDAILNAISEPCDEIFNKDLFAGSMDALFKDGGLIYNDGKVSSEVASMLLKVKKYIAVKTLLAFSKVKIKDASGTASWKDKTSGGFCGYFDSSLQKLVDGKVSWGQFAPLVVKNTDNVKNEASSTTFWKTFGKAILNYLGGSPAKSFKKLINYGGISGPRAWSDPGGNGNILISSDPGHFSVYDDVKNQWNTKYNPDPWVIKKYVTTIDRAKIN